MPTLDAPTLLTPVYTGAAPLSISHGKFAFNGAAAGTVVRLNQLYAGMKVYGAKLVNAALGSGTTVELGFLPADSSLATEGNKFLSATSTSTANAVRSNNAPILLENDGYLIATLAGGAATGEINAELLYEPTGA
jgi:hypothetical protein